MKVSPEAFRSDIPPERVIGTEGEYTVWGREDGRLIVGSQYITAGALKAIRMRQVGYFLANGGKLYGDVGGKLEYATPECLGPAEAAAQDQYGIHLVQRLVANSKKSCDGMYRVAGTFLDTEDPDYDPQFGKTSGFHHNYLVPAYLKNDDDLLREVLGSHLATRVWAWAGTVRPEEGFVLAQKMWGIGAPVGFGWGNRTGDGKKPMAAILLSDKDTTGDTDNWMRVEDRSADPALSVEMTELTLATTSLVLRIIEHAHKLNLERPRRVSGRRRLLGLLALQDQVAAGRQFAGDLSLTSTVETRRGERVTALDIQERLALLAIELSSKVRLPADEHKAAYVWFDLIQALRASNPQDGKYTLLAKEHANFVPRHRYLTKKAESREVRDARSIQRNLYWDRVDQEGLGLQYHHQIAVRRGKPWPVVPKTPRTRAAIRGKMLRSGGVSAASWVHVTKGGKRLNLLDPFQTELQPDQVQ